MLEQTVTGDETWINDDTPESKRRSMQWKHQNSPTVVKFKKPLTVQKSMASVFWDSKGVILVNFIQRGTTINGEQYRNTLMKLQLAIKIRRPGKLSHWVLLLHDDFHPHTANDIINLTEKFKWTLLPHPPYSPDLAASDYHLLKPADGAQRNKIWNGIGTTKFRPWILPKFGWKFL